MARESKRSRDIPTSYSSIRSFNRSFGIKTESLFQHSSDQVIPFCIDSRKIALVLGFHPPLLQLAKELDEILAHVNGLLMMERTFADKRGVFYHSMVFNKWRILRYALTCDPLGCVFAFPCFHKPDVVAAAIHLLPNNRKHGYTGDKGALNLRSLKTGACNTMGELCIPDCTKIVSTISGNICTMHN
jgi:hypothetical protein